MTKVTFPVFQDRQYNRFLVESIYHSKDSSISWAYLRAFSAGLNVREVDPLVLEVSETGVMLVEHIKHTIYSTSLANGACEICLISGPLFDKLKAEVLLEEESSSTVGQP